MPLVRASMKQLEAAQRLYEKAQRLIETAEEGILDTLIFDMSDYYALVDAVNNCRGVFSNAQES